MKEKNKTEPVFNSEDKKSSLRRGNVIVISCLVLLQLAHMLINTGYQCRQNMMIISEGWGHRQGSPYVGGKRYILSFIMGNL